MDGWIALALLIVVCLGVGFLLYVFELVLRNVSGMRSITVPIVAGLAGMFGLAALAHAQTNGIMRDGFEPEGWCPSGRVTQTVMSWRYDGIGRALTDVRFADNIWGKTTASGVPLPYPWMNYFAIFWQLPRSGYVAAQFDLAPWVPLWQYNTFWHGETSGGPHTDLAISDRCGDFNPAEEWCAKFDTYTGHMMVRGMLPESPALVGCVMQPLGRYYVNVRFSDPTEDHFDCGHAVCRTTIQNNRNP